MSHQRLPRPARALLWIILLGSITGCDRVKDLQVGKGFSARYLCSYVFNTGHDEALVKQRFLAPKVMPLPLIWKVDVNYEDRSVTVADRIFLNESLKAKAVYRDGIGCTLLVDRDKAEVLNQPFEALPAPQLPVDQPWPEGHAGIDEQQASKLDQELLEEALAKAFTERHRKNPMNTTSFLVAHKGRLVAERYALGVGPHTPVAGWSMTKTITGSLIAILHDRGLIALDQPAPIAAWQGTPKAEITVANLLQMASGLAFDDGYKGLSEVTRMLYQRSNQAEYVASLPLAFEPGTRYNYSTGDSNLLAKIVQDTVGGSMQDGYNFYQTELFHKIGITSGLIEFDASGQFVGGAYGFLSPRDWLRFGQLYLQEGKWNGEAVLSSEWIQYATQPSAANPGYGAQIWLNTDADNDGYGDRWPMLPLDTYHFQGHLGQYVVIIPTLQLVVVRTGVTEYQPVMDLGENIRMVVEALPTQ